MELVHERSLTPLFISLTLLFLAVTGSYGLTHLIYSSQSDINRTFWYMERAAGLTAYELLTLTVCLGLTTYSGVWDKWKARQIVTQVHQYVSILFVPFLILHLFGLWQDKMVPFTPVTLLIPFQAVYRPLWTGFGILALYGVILLIVTSMLQRKIGARVWRRWHLISFPVFVLATCHGIFSGTDSNFYWARMMYIVSTSLFVVLLMVRMTKGANVHGGIHTSR